MFCPECGTEVAESATFCRKCGTPLRDDVVRPAAPTQASAQVVASHAPTVGSGVGAGQPLIGILVIIGAAIAAIGGALLPWVDVAGQTANGFDVGYLTKSNGGGKDGIVILILALAAAIVAIHYFRMNSSLASAGSFFLGGGAAGVAVYDLVRIVSYFQDRCNGCNPTDYLGMGLYVAIVGGVIAAGTAFFGLRREWAAEKR